MAKKVFLITIKETGKLTSNFEAYLSLEKAVKEIQCVCDAYGFQMQKTELRNEFQIYSGGCYRHTLQIIDLWVL